MSWREGYQLVKQTASQWYEDNALRLGAALAYYSIFSLAPLLIIAIAIASLAFGPQAHERIVAQIKTTVGDGSSQAVADMLAHASQPGSGGVWATVIGVIVLLFGATSVFGELQSSLNMIWKVAPKPGGTIWNFLKDRFFSFVIVLVIGILLLASLIITTALEAVGKVVVPGTLTSSMAWWQLVNGVVSFGFFILLFALIFKILPDVKLAWRDVWIGAAVTALLSTLGRYLIGLYLGRSSVASAYGAAGSLIAILVWIYYSSLILFFGAEFTRVYALKDGGRIEPTANAILLPDANSLPQERPPVRERGTPARSQGGDNREKAARL